MAKNLFDLQLEKFAKIVMGFWHYFKLETYYYNYRLVFKLDQTIFDDVVKTVGSLKQTSELKTLAWIFNSIFKNFNSKFNVHLKLFEYVWTPSINFKISWTKNEKSFIVKALYETTDFNTILRLINFYDNSFIYSFFINPSSKDLKIDNDKYSFLHIIEFEVG
ncbi:hypothetical protein [Spiroplasma endosymbiont of Ammophila pubescens]|uniref:hypothetical protein n=1 Tax=Spiroplasma endosymbiont of Ammophila pubescens TaxID=3066315 RepID=UPI0032B125D4